MLKGFYETDKEFIVSESKRLFGKDVCRTCHSEIVKAYNDLKTYYLNQEIMAKKNEEMANIAEGNAPSKKIYKVKERFAKSQLIKNGRVYILGHLEGPQIESLLSEKEIAIYFE